MARGKVNRVPINDGVCGKVYLAAYRKRIKKYRIAEKIYGRSPAKRKGKGGRVKNPNLVITAISKNPGLFDQNEKGVISRTEPLLAEIKRHLQQRQEEELVRKIHPDSLVLTPEEEAELNRYLDTRLRELVDTKVVRSEDVHPLSYFFSLIGGTAMFAVLSQQLFPASLGRKLVFLSSDHEVVFWRDHLSPESLLAREVMYVGSIFKFLESGGLGLFKKDVADDLKKILDGYNKWAEQLPEEPDFGSVIEFVRKKRGELASCSPAFESLLDKLERYDLFQTFHTAGIPVEDLEREVLG
ncbi:MAG: hypothetical protein Q7R39_18215 [Dehalococcoidia bacterium]|nr:hypothetical protein [Dehalococcoidia bacterium]